MNNQTAAGRAADIVLDNNLHAIEETVGDHTQSFVKGRFERITRAPTDPEVNGYGFRIG